MAEMKSYEMDSVTNDTFILKNENELEQFFKMIKEGKEEHFIVKWTEKSMFGGNKRKSKIITTKNIQENVKNGRIKIYSNAQAY